MSDIKRGMRVKWMSRAAEALYGRVHWFYGRVLSVHPADADRGIMEIAVIDDGTDLTYRCVHTYKLLRDNTHD